jgi:integrase
MKFKDFAKIYLDNHAMPTKKSWRKDFAYINRTLNPTFGKLAMTSIKRMDVMRWFTSLSQSSGPYYANRALEILRKIFNCAIDWEVYEGRNPATRIKKNKEVSRTEFVTPDILPRLLVALTVCRSRQIRVAILFQLFSGLRPGEVLSLRWEDVDLDGRQFHVRHTKNGSTHTLPLTNELAELLSTLPRKGEWVFVGRRSNQPLRNIHKQWYAIRLAADLPWLRLHDLRRTVGSYLAIANFSERIIGQILNHQSAKSTRIYSRLTLDPLRTALEHHGQRVQALATGANVLIPLLHHEEERLDEQTHPPCLVDPTPQVAAPLPCHLRA